MDHDRRGNVAFADRPDAPEQFPGGPEPDTQPIPAIRWSMDWADDLGEPRDPAVAMDPGVGVEPDPAPVEPLPAAGAEVTPQPGPRTAAPARRFLVAGLVVALGLAVAVALTLILALALPPHAAGTGAAGRQAPMRTGSSAHEAGT